VGPSPSRVSIQKFNEGNYQLLVFETEAGLNELDRRMKNSDRILRHMIVRTDLDHKRAEKLAKRNPKKERLRSGSVLRGQPVRRGSRRSRGSARADEAAPVE